MRNQYCRQCACKLTGDCVTLDGIPYHRYCLKCSGCGATLRSLDFFKKSDKFYCTSCNQRTFGKYCKLCKDPIRGEYIAVGNNAFHTKCFRCQDCHSLIGTPYYSLKGRILCKSDWEKRIKREQEENRIVGSLDEPDTAPSFSLQEDVRGHSKVTVSGDFNFSHPEEKLDQQEPELDFEEEKKPKHSKLASAFYCIMGSCI